MSDPTTDRPVARPVVIRTTPTTRRARPPWVEARIRARRRARRWAWVAPPDDGTGRLFVPWRVALFRAVVMVGCILALAAFDWLTHGR